jgi:hypothetical protein
MYCTNVVLHGEKNCKEEHDLVARESQTTACNLGQRRNNAIITGLSIIVKDADYRV